MTYKNCKKLIQNDRYEYQDMLNKLGVFLLADSITLEQYTELKDLMDNNEIYKNIKIEEEG